MQSHDKGEMPALHGSGAGEPAAVLQHLLTGAELLASQLPSPSHWSPEMSLAGAVLATALMDIRMRRPGVRNQRRVGAALRWIRSDDAAWPLSFLRICELFDLEPDWVRRVVTRWMRADGESGRSGYRQAA